MCELHRHARNERARPLFATSLSRAGTLSLTFPSYLLVLPSHLSSVRLYFPVSGLHHPSIASSGLQLVNLSRLSLPVFSLSLSVPLARSITLSSFSSTLVCVTHFRTSRVPSASLMPSCISIFLSFMKHLFYNCYFVYINKYQDFYRFSLRNFATGVN